MGRLARRVRPKLPLHRLLSHLDVCLQEGEDADEGEEVAGEASGNAGTATRTTMLVCQMCLARYRLTCYI